MSLGIEKANTPAKYAEVCNIVIYSQLNQANYKILQFNRPKILLIASYCDLGAWKMVQVLDGLLWKIVFKFQAKAWRFLATDSSI